MNASTRSGSFGWIAKELNRSLSSDPWATREWFRCHLWVIQVPLVSDSGATCEWFRCHSWVIQVPLVSDSGATREWFRCHLWVIQVPLVSDSGATREWFRRCSQLIRNSAIKPSCTVLKLMVHFLIFWNFIDVFFWLDLKNFHFEYLFWFHVLCFAVKQMISLVQ